MYVYDSLCLRFEAFYLPSADAEVKFCCLQQASAGHQVHSAGPCRVGPVRHGVGKASTYLSREDERQRVERGRRRQSCKLSRAHIRLDDEEQSRRWAQTLCVSGTGSKGPYAAVWSYRARRPMSCPYLRRSFGPPSPSPSRLRVRRRSLVHHTVARPRNLYASTPIDDLPRCWVVPIVGVHLGKLQRGLIGNITMHV